ncbi:MAG TPA: DUF2842 domain-containing protein [Caulobacteraceae bacterium]|nr:DUF2842 domain-containing protein [Caulobacteraceae bacterium]
MSPRLRSLIVSVAIVLFVPAYIWVAIFVAGRLPENRWVMMAFYAVAGTAWGLPLFPLLSWINKGQKPR